MTPTHHSPASLWAGGLATFGFILVAYPAHAAVLREARLDIVFTSGVRCEVTASFVVETTDPPALEHRLHLLEGAVVTEPEIDGSVALESESSVSARTRALRLTSRLAGDQRYRLRYAVTQPDAGAYRCPLWLPTTPTDGRSQDVTIRVLIPPDAVSAGGGLPALAWDGPVGTARLGHMPGFVRVPFAAPGEVARRWPDITRLMDLVAISVLIGCSIWFVWRRRRR